MALQGGGEEARLLEDLRRAVRECDESLVALAARRTLLCRRIGHLKHRIGAGVRNTAVERVVIGRARAVADVHGFDPDAAEELVRLLIEHSVRQQLLDRAPRVRPDAVVEQDLLAH